MNDNRPKLRILVLGIGNVLLSDEGLGVAAVAALAAKYRLPDQVELLDGGTAGFELLGQISNKDCLIIVDALKNGAPPGTVLRLAGAEVPAAFMTRISPHQLGISDVLAAAMLLGELPARLVLFGMEPQSLATGCGLSATVAANLERLLAMIITELEELDCEPELLAATQTAAAAPGMWRFER